MSRRTSIASLAAAAAALAVAVPTAGAKPVPVGGPFLGLPAGAQTCQILGTQGQLPILAGNAVYANAQSQLFSINGC